MDKHAIAKKIRSLLGMTVENGASEAEAEFAWRKASELMREHHMSMSEAQIRANKIETIEIELFTIWGKKQPKEYQVKSRLSASIEMLCGVKIWQERSREKLIIVGLYEDAEFAKFLLESLPYVAYLACKQHIKQLPAEQKKDTRIVYRDFYQGYANAVYEKVKGLRDSMKKDATTDGTSVVWVKDNMVEQHLESIGINFRKSPRLTIKNAEHYFTGKSEGSKANLNRPVDTQEQKLLGT